MKTLWAVSGFVVALTFSIAVTPSAASFGSFQQTQQYLVIHPTTTVALETSNNTSASNTFAGQNTGNMAASNISKVDTHTLLYSGSTTKVFAHFMPWFCMPDQCANDCSLHSNGYLYCHGHVTTGYDSNDAAQVANQVNDMISRKLQGMIIDWYGPTYALENGTTLKVAAEAKKHSPSEFQFIIMVDGGQYKSCNGDATCIQNGLISDLTYVGNNFVGSPNYGKTSNGYPYVFFFNPYSNVNWDTVNNAVASFHFQYIFENDGGFTHAHSGGAFSWVGPHHPEDDGWESYLDDFYATAKKDEGGNHNLHTFGSDYKGFNDNLATWGSDRVISQHCGNTWQKTWGHLNKAYSQSNQLDNVQLPTWNDYDEGSELESGIDNCLSITASVNNATGILSWSLGGSGDPSTVDHFTLFASADDYNLMVIQDNIPSSQRSLSLGSFNLPSNTYLRVKAVGQPTILNHLSQSGVLFTSGSGGGIQGEIYSALDQHPISGATVSCSLGQRTTDRNGHYEYDHVQSGEYTLTASASGWLQNQTTVTVQNSMATGNIPMATAGKVAGWVRNGGGHGLADAFVTCHGGIIPILQTYPSYGNGNFGSSWIPYGNYSCTATAPGYAPNIQPMQVQTGQTTTLNFTMNGTIQRQ